MKWERYSHWVLGIVALSGWLATAGPVAAQQSIITVDGDIRVFAVLSALSAAGADLGPAATSSVVGLREKVRAAQEKVPADLMERLQQFYITHRQGDDRITEISKYVSLALVMDQPPKFGFVWSQDKLPPDALAVAEFEPLVKEFWEAAHLTRIWSGAQIHLDQLIDAYQSPIMTTIQRTEGYLRLPSSSYLGRHYFILVDVLGSVPGALARNYGDDYFLVIPPASRPNVTEIRHQFLHFVLDPLSLRAANHFYHKRALFELAVNNPNLDPQFKKEFNLFVIECIIRALEIRLDKLPPARAEDELARNAGMGFFLIRHFYNQFELFEKQEQGIRESIGDMVEAINVDEVKKYAASLPSVSAPPPAPAPKKVMSENERRLDEAEDLVSEEKYEPAKKIFREVADTDETLRAKALYGLGVVCSLQHSAEDAQDYFQRALATKGIDPATQVWAHIYLGRLYDLQGQRETAIREYAAAVQMGDDTRGAQAAAKQGLVKPFGTKDSPK